jgi:hypothetical protein
MLFLRQKVKLGDRIILSILLIQAVYCLIAMCLHGFFFLGMDYKYFNLSIQFVAVAIVYIYIQTFFCIHKVAKSSVYVMALMGVMGAIAFFLGIFGLIGPFTTDGTLGVDGRAISNFFFTYSTSIMTMPSFTFIRVAGFFDEPGTFAYYITFALLTNKLYSYSKSLEWVLIVTGLFTFSLAFIITLMFYYFIFYNPFRSFKTLFIFIVPFAFIVLFLAYGDRSESEIGQMIHKTTIGRLYTDEKASGQLFVGDNRSELFGISWNAFTDSPLIGHGESVNENVRSKYYDARLGANLFYPLAIHGILGAPILFLAYIYLTYLVFVHPRKRDRVAMGAWLIMFINFLQRPSVHGGLYGYFAIIFLIEATKYRILSLKNSELNKF